MYPAGNLRPSLDLGPENVLAKSLSGSCLLNTFNASKEPIHFHSIQLCSLPVALSIEPDRILVALLLPAESAILFSNLAQRDNYSVTEHMEESTTAKEHIFAVNAKCTHF